MEVPQTDTQKSAQLLRTLQPGEGNMAQAAQNSSDGELPVRQPEPRVSEIRKVFEQARNRQIRRDDQANKEQYLQRLRNMHLSYNLFEVQTDYRLDDKLDLERIIIENTATDEVIRKIPPHKRPEFPTPEPLRTEPRVDVSG